MATHRTRRFLARAALVAALALALLYATRSRTLAPLVERLARAPLERALGARLTLGSIRGNLLTHLVVEDLALAPLSGGRPAVAAVEGARLELRYSPGLLLGRLDALERVALRARRVALDLGAAAGAEPPAAPGEPAGAPPGRLPALDVALEELRVRLADGPTLAARGLRATGGGPEPVALAAALSCDEPALALDLRARGTWDGERARLDELRLAEPGGLAGAPALALTRAELDLSGAAPAVSLEGTLLGGTLAAHGPADALAVELTDLSLARLAPFLAEPELAGALDARGTLDLAAGTWQLALEGRALAWGALRLDGLQARAADTPDALALSELRAWRGDNRLAADALRLAHGPEPLLLALEGALSLELHDLPLLAGLPADARVPDHAVELAGRLRAGVLAIERARVTTEGGALVLRQGTLRVPADGDLARARVALDVEVAFDELGELARLVGSDALRGALAGSLAVEGPLDAPHGELDGRVRGLSAFGRALGDGALRLALDAGRAELRSLELDGGVGRLSASGALELEPPALDGLVLRGSALDLAALGIEALPAGELDLELALDGPLAAPTGSLALEARGLAAGGVALDRARLRAEIDGGGAGAEARVRVSELALEAGARRVTLAGTLAGLTPGAGGGPWSATIDALEAEAPGARLALAAPATLRVLDATRWTLEPLRLEGPGLLQLSARRAGASAWRADLVLDGLDPSPWLSGALAAARTSGVDASVQAERDQGGLRARFDVRLAELRVGSEDAPWTALARGALEEGRLTLEQLVLEHARVGTLVASGAVPLDPLAEEPLAPGELALRASADLDLAALARRVPLAPADLAGALRLEADLAGTWEAARGRAQVALDAVALDPLGPGFVGRRADLRLALAADDTCRLESLALESAALGRVEAHGSVGAPLPLAGLVRGTLGGWREAPLALELELALEDVGWLAARSDALRRAAGTVQGTLELSGTPARPSYAGTLAVDDASLRLASDFPAIERLAARLRFREREVELEQLTGELGAAPFTARGSLALPGGERAEPELALELEGQNLLLARSNGLRVRGDARLAVAGPLSALRAQGDVALTEGRYARDLDFLGALRGEAAPPSAGGRGLSFQLWRDEPLARMTLDVGVRGPLRVDNNVADAVVRPDLRLRGTGEVPLVTGRVYVDPGRLSLPSGSLLVDSGLVEFRPDAPFTPALELSGRSRIKGYDVGVRVSGDALAPEIELWSTPPLPADQLLVLFLTGELPDGDTASRSEAAARTVAVYLARDFLARWLRGDSEGGNGLLERLDIEVGADVTRSGAPTTEVSYYFSDRPRDVGRVPFLSAERDKYDKVNLGIGFLFRLP